MSEQSEANKIWENQVEFLKSNSYTEFLGINGEPIEFEWSIFPGFYVIGDDPENLQDRNIEPENFEGRIVFMSMFNDTDWMEREN